MSDKKAHSASEIAHQFINKGIDVLPGEDGFELSELIDEHKLEFERWCSEYRSRGSADDQTDSDYHLFGKIILFLINKGYLKDC